jgi:hypothetical protein
MGLLQLMILINLNDDLMPVIGFQPIDCYIYVACSNRIAIFGKTRHTTLVSTGPTLTAVDVAIIRITIIRDIWRQPKGNTRKYVTMSCHNEQTWKRSQQEWFALYREYRRRRHHRQVIEMKIV